MGEEIRADGPQSHLVKKGTPTMGGMVFIFTAAVMTLLFNKSRTQTLFPIFIASAAGLFGIMEDFAKVYRRSSLNEVFKLTLTTNPQPRFSDTKLVKLLLKPWYYFMELSRVIGSASGRGLHTYQKLIIQSVIAGFVSYWTYFKLGWDFLWLPLIGDVHIGFFYPIFVFFLFLLVLNFVAFTDGIDGLAGGLAAISFTALWVVASALEYNSIGTLCAVFIGALLPFLYFNIHPARIFMGDVGSHVLGAAISILAVVMHREIGLLFICAVFLVDGISSPLQQFSVKLTKKRLFRMAPIHHHFELLGWPESKVTMRFWLFGAIGSLIGIFVCLL